MEKLCTIIIISSMFIVATTSYIATDEIEAAERWIQAYNSRLKTRKPDLTLQFYVQDVLAGPQTTVWEVARAKIITHTDFGQVRVVDDLITSGPDPATSHALGRAQGMITSSDLKVDAMVINMIYKFDYGPYNGSSLSVLGRSQIFNETRELIVAGGTGVFQMARGYAIGKTNKVSDDGKGHVTSAVFEYKVYLYQCY